MFLGPPGVGKGTQAKGAAEAQGVPHISSGDMLREAIRNGTPTGLKAKEYVNSGKLVPDGVMVDLIAERISQPDCRPGFLLDGFPRTLPQAEALDAMLKAKGRGPVEVVVCFQADEATIVERLSGRRLCRSCGANYHVKFMPPKNGKMCDKCGGELYQRADDQPATVKERLRVYEQQTAALIEYYRRRGALREVAGAASVEEVGREVRAALAWASARIHKE